MYLLDFWGSQGSFRFFWGGSKEIFLRDFRFLEAKRIFLRFLEAAPVAEHDKLQVELI